jgi:glyoxylase-like metal-dependent hydrolase (beta-lactamase superfamily II)
MITIERYGDVARLHMSHWRSRAVGYSVSAFLVRGVLIDTGFPAAHRRLARLLDELRPRAVVVTHHHEDHAGNVALVAARGLPVAMPDETLGILRPGEPGIGLYRRATWGRILPLDAAPLVRLGDDDLRALGLELLATPGHATDHHAVWDAERRVLYGGDLWLGMKVRVARPNEDPRVHAASLRHAAALAPVALFDAHRGRVDDPVGSLLAKADWIEETIARIERRAAEGASERRITREVLGTEAPVAYASRGDLSKRNFVRVVLRGRPPGA